jgi:hypothetical protein
MDPRLFQALASDLLKHRRPASNRAAIGRAYYSMYNVAAGYISANGMKVHADAKGHQDVIRTLQGSGDREIEQLGQILDDLREHRSEADYEMSNIDPEDDQHAALWVTNAGDGIKALDVILNGARAAAVIAGMKRYQRDVLRYPVKP